MFETLKAGGILMLPIILCGVIATFIIIERCFYFYVTKKRDAKLMYDLNESLKIKNFELAKENCVEADTPTAQVVKKAIDCRDWNESDLREVVEAEMEIVVPRFEHLLTPLGTIANIATHLWLLRTVTGNIKAFSVLGGGGSMGDPAALAGAIGEALMTTVAGLIVSIPSIIFYNYFVSRVRRRIAEMESNVTSVLIKLFGRV